MNMRKDILFNDSGPVTAVPRREPVPEKKPSVGARLFALAVEIPPVAYVALTGDVPVWVRTWLIGWLSLWMIVTVVTATKAGSTS